MSIFVCFGKKTPYCKNFGRNVLLDETVLDETVLDETVLDETSRTRIRIPTQAGNLRYPFLLGHTAIFT